MAGASVKTFRYPEDSGLDSEHIVAVSVDAHPAVTDIKSGFGNAVLRVLSASTGPGHGWLEGARVDAVLMHEGRTIVECEAPASRPLSEEHQKQLARAVGHTLSILGVKPVDIDGETLVLGQTPDPDQT